MRRAGGSLALVRQRGGDPSYRNRKREVFARVAADRDLDAGDAGDTAVHDDERRPRRARGDVAIIGDEP